MKKILFLVASVFIFSGCTPQIPENSDANIPAVEFGDAIDLTNLFAQVCETKDGPCKNISCTLIEDIYTCYENVSKREEGCSSVKTKDDVIAKYKICGLGFSDSGKKLDAEKYSIFNYGQSLELLEMGGDTPAEFEQKIKEETQIVEEGGMSDFLSTMMAVAAGSIIGGMISNALFNRNNAAPPRSAATHKEEPFDKKKLDDTKKSTSENSSKIKDSVSKTKQKSANTAKKTAAKKSAAKKASQKKATQKKRSPSKKRSSRRRR